MKNLNTYFLFFFLLILSSCDIELTEQQVTNPDEFTIADLKAASTFNWKNTQDAKVTIYTKDNSGKPVPNVKVSIWTNFEEENGVEIITGVTDNQGLFTIDYNFEADMEEVVLKTDFIGFIPESKVPIDNGNVYFTFGGTRDGQKSQYSSKNSFYSKVNNTVKSKWNSNININYIGAYNGNGVPDYLLSEGDYISPELLNDLNIALPENRPVPEYHPEYLIGGNEQNLVVLDEAEVWITFVSEGAGYRNVLAYYTYDRDFPPTTPEDIKDCYVIFPNVSFAGSGGGLYSGDKVSLGTFPKNTVIGWMLMRDGWNGPNQQSTEGRGLLYSNSE